MYETFRSEFTTLRNSRGRSTILALFLGTFNREKVLSRRKEEALVILAGMSRVSGFPVSLFLFRLTRSREEIESVSRLYGAFLPSSLLSLSLLVFLLFLPNGLVKFYSFSDNLFFSFFVARIYNANYRINRVGRRVIHRGIRGRKTAMKLCEKRARGCTGFFN